MSRHRKGDLRLATGAGAAFDAGVDLVSDLRLATGAGTGAGAAFDAGVVDTVLVLDAALDVAFEEAEAVFDALGADLEAAVEGATADLLTLPFPYRPLLNF